MYGVILYLETASHLTMIFPLFSPILISLITKLIENVVVGSNGSVKWEDCDNAGY